LTIDVASVRPAIQTEVRLAAQVSARGLKRYQDDRFGMFVHWGLYSLIGASEWVMFHDRYSVAEYERLAERFNPVNFDAKELAQIAADAGQRYLTITSRHHDGFSMYDTALSDYKISSTTFARDPIAELADACRDHGIRLGFYVSVLDWHHPAYRETFRRKNGLAWDEYVAFLHGQIRELCTNYGDIGEFWLDGYWPVSWPWLRFPNWFVPGGDLRLEEAIELIHELQPDAVVMNNRHSPPAAGEDVQGYEGDVPGDNTNLVNGTPPLREALETCQTLTASGYGFQRHDHHYRPASELLTMLVRAAGAGANFLLNVGPTGAGEVARPARDRLAELGAWLRVNGEGIYGTRAGTLTLSDPASGDPPAIEGVATTVDPETGVHYVHLLDGRAPTTIYAELAAGEHADSARATLLHDGEEVDAEVRGDGDSVVLTVPSERRGGLATTVRLELA